MFSKKPKSSAPTRPAAASTATTGNLASSQQKTGVDWAFDEPSTLPEPVVQCLEAIRAEWVDLTYDDYNPVPVALSLLETSTLSRDYPAFCTMYSELEKAMDIIIDEYHQAFNTSIHTFSSVVDAISDSQMRTRALRDNLDRCKGLLECKNEDIRRTPEKLESLMQGKFFLSAVKTLLNATKTLKTREFMDIGAVANIRQDLEQMKGVLNETLIEELHNHLYLKSPFSQERVERFGGVGDETEARVVTIESPNRRQSVYNKGGKSSKTKSNDVTEDYDTNPEADSLQYMSWVVEGLALLGALPNATEVIKQRLNLEIFYVIERTIQEISDRESRGDVPRPPALKAFASIVWKSKENQGYILTELLTTLYVRLKTVLHGHFYILSLIPVLAQRNINTGTPAYNIRDVWNVIQSEVKALLYDYLSASQRQIGINNPIASLNEMFERKSPQPRSKVFRITAGNVSNDPVARLYHAIAPVSRAATVSANASSLLGSDDTSGSVHVVDKYATATSTGHRLLIAPDPANILMIFDMTMKFIEKSESTGGIAPTGTFKKFLDDFVLSVFLPQLETRVMELFHEFVNGDEAFQMDHIIEFPLFKSAVGLTVLIQGMCRILPVMPVHKTEFIQLIETLLVKFHEKLSARYWALMSADSSDTAGEADRNIISCVWAHDPDLLKLVVQNTFFDTQRDVDLEVNRHLSERETYVEMRLKNERSFHRGEMVFDYKKLQGLATLHYTSQWFVSQLAMLTTSEAPPVEAVSTSPVRALADMSVSEMYVKWSSDSLPGLAIEPDDVVELELDSEMIKKFDVLLSNCKSLSDRALITLRLEARCHVMYYLDLAIREGNYWLDDEPVEPDPYINALNQDLTMCEEAMSTVLPIPRIRFLFDGLASLMTRILCSNLRHIKRLNRNGIAKMIRNVQSLQQNLTNIASIHEKALDHARQYYDLLNLGGEGMVKFMECNGSKYDFDEYKALLDQIYHDVFTKDASSNKKVYQDLLARIKAHFVKGAKALQGDD
ncbi:hypothetical protein SmJEL517_g00823 [Synchytrium microbalum]|uniref:Exocyst complex component Sec8 n=1 Tax=Synchytrium microbalum TaxID=1806994 RepID=A0A507C7K2_9FUNG|nr:uncharacterized protein SmJEL517_g00823 [Synchytrium microbalum]TPX37027.1 hypothetical protein SmJEL517_g00823 [Synchytrium microbalum]